MHDEMGYFKDFKFGVPVDITCDGKPHKDRCNARLIFEDETVFTVITDDGPYTYSFCKDSYKYCPIPYLVDPKHRVLHPRYPLVSNKQHTAYCNVRGDMSSMMCADDDNISKVRK